MFNRTLVCILSETRASQLSWPSFKPNVLDALNADLAVCIAVPDTYDYQNPFWQHARYRFTCREFDDWGEAFDIAQVQMLGRRAARPDWRTLLDVPGTWLGGVKHTSDNPGAASILLFLRWYLLLNLREANLLSTYERIIVTRSDFIWETTHPPMEALDERFMWLPDGERYGGYPDRHVVMSRDNAEAYLNVLDPILRTPERLKQELACRPDWNIEQYIHFQFKRIGMAEKVRYFPYVMYTAREWGGATRWSAGVWSDAHGYYIKYPSELALATRYKPLFPDRRAWLDYFGDQDRMFLGQMLSPGDGEVLYFKDGGLAVRKVAEIMPPRHILKADIVDGSVSPYFGDYELDFATLLPQFTPLTAAQAGRDKPFTIRLADGRFLAIDANKTVVASAEPTPFRML